MAYSLLHDVVMAPKNGPVRKITTGRRVDTQERILIRAELFGIGEIPKVECREWSMEVLS